VQQQHRESIARFAAERRRRFEAAADLRGVDAEQPHPADVGHDDRVAVDHGPDEHEIGCAGADGDRRGLKNCERRGEENRQKLHTRLLVA
jgi:hypothetical protein